MECNEMQFFMQKIDFATSLASHHATQDGNQEFESVYPTRVFEHGHGERSKNHSFE
jgi:hypothetical protein